MTDVELRLTADVGQATKNVGGFRKEYADLVKALEKPLRQVTAFRDLELSLEGTQREARSARDRVRDLGNEMARTANPSKELTASYRDAVNELRRLERAEATAQGRLAGRRRELQSAGVDTRNLAIEQQRLTRELEAAQAGGRNEQAVTGIRARAAALAQVTREQRLANLEAARADLGVNRYRALQAELGQTRRNYELLRRSGNLTAAELAVAQRALTQRVQETRAAMKGLLVDQTRMRAAGASALVATGGVIGGAFAAVRAVQGVASITDAYTLMNARLKLATESQEEFNTAQAGLESIAKATETPMASLVTLYGRISRPLKEAGRSQAEILQVTEAVATSFRVSGASAAEAENGVIQFAQALGAGALRGDEFNSVAEQAPRLMQALADGIGVPVGALKEMAAQGQLTSAIVTDALTSQLDVLRKEAETLPDTVGGAMTDLTDRWNKAIGQADVSGLISAINELADTVSDPEIVSGLAQIAAAMATLAGWTVTVASEFAGFGDKVAFTAAQLSAGSEEAAQQVRELEKMKRALDEVNAARTGSSFLGSGTVPLLMKFFAPEQLDTWAAELEEKIRAFEQKLYGISEGEAAQESQVSEQLQGIRDKELESRRQYIAQLETQQTSLIKSAESAGKELVAAEKAATQELERVRADRVKIEERYQKALAGLNGSGQASYGAAQSLKVGARQALQAGDIEGAKAQAQAALKMLQDLAAAGESTYGFEGFIKELQGIELAANDIEKTNADKKLRDITEELQAVQRLSKIKIEVGMSPEAIEEAKAQMEELAKVLSKSLIITPTIIDTNDYSQPYTLQDPGPAPGFSGGGWTGPGAKYQPAGVVHAGEHVQPQEVVREPGALAFLERIRRNGFRATLDQLRLRGYASGGPVVPVPRFVPSIPTPSPALLEAVSGRGGADLLRNWGRATLGYGADEYEVLIKQDSFDKLLGRTRAKFGRTHS